MIGLVVVSHSRPLAEGLCALAAEMAAPELKIVAAGGIEGDPAALGTDLPTVLNAIEKAWSEDGVLVLADLGSALLSSEMAIEQLQEHLQSRVILSGAPLVEGTVAAAALAGTGASLAEVATEAANALAGKTEQFGTPTEPGQESPSQEVDQPKEAGEELRMFVTDPLGLHARPAALVVRAVGNMDAKVEVFDASTGRGPAPGASLSSLSALGLARGHEMVVVARGPDAANALAAVAAAAEGVFATATPPTLPAGEALELGDSGAAWVGGEMAVKGVGVTHGVCLGPARRVGRHRGDYHPSEDPAVEAKRLRDAISKLRAELGAGLDAIGSSIGAGNAAVIEAQTLFLDDEALAGEAFSAIEKGVDAQGAWEAATGRQLRAWRSVEDPYLLERAGDLALLADRVSDALAGAEAKRAESGAVLVAGELSVADVATMGPAAAGVICAQGGATSHAAILLRALGIPAVFGVGNDLLGVPDGTLVLVDADRGEVVVEPTEDSRRGAFAQARRSEAHRARSALHKAEPAVTADGVGVSVLANASTAGEVAAAIAGGADGIGLFRTELLFAQGLPGLPEQVELLSTAVGEAGGRPFVLRLLDIGSDKPMPGIGMNREPNPALGVRGIRLLMQHQELFGLHALAIAQLVCKHRVSVMVPMVALASELRHAKEVLGAALESQGVSGVPIGAMVEVPSAALGAARLAKEADFLSIGTNDLAQYVTAADRASALPGGLGDALHPAVLQLIADTAAAAAAAGRPVSVCGELASDPGAAEILVGLGVRSFSVSPHAVGEVKEAVRACRAESAQELAKAALGCEDAAEVAALLIQARSS